MEKDKQPNIWSHYSTKGLAREAFRENELEPMIKAFQEAISSPDAEVNVDVDGSQNGRHGFFRST